MPGAFELAATLSFDGDQEIYLLTGKGEIIKRLTSSWGSDVSPSFSPDGKRVVTASRDKAAKVWDIETGRDFWTLSGHSDRVHRPFL